MKNVISVIVPVYNVEQYLPGCIESIQKQTYRDLEIILVDDGSTDHSGKICEQYAALDPRISVIHKANGGLVTARKAGLEAATGRYTGFVDGDDYIEERFYEHLLCYLHQTDADFVHSGIVAETADGAAKMLINAADKEYTDKENKTELIQKHIVSHDERDEEYFVSILCSKLFRTDFIKDCYCRVPDHLSFGEDILTLCRCILKSGRFAVLAQAEYHYIIRDTSISHMWSMDKFWQESSLHHALCALWKEYGCHDQMKDYMDHYLTGRMVHCMNYFYNKGLGTVAHILPDKNSLKAKRLVIYGAGKMGKDYVSQMILDPRYHIVAWTDQKFVSRHNQLCMPVSGLKDMVFDIVLIAVKEEHAASEIKKQLLRLGISEEKIVWFLPEEQICV